MRKIAFVDRDGTLIEEPTDEQVDAIEKVQLLADVIPALLALKDAGYEFIMVTNQDGLGTESFPEADFWPAHRHTLKLFETQGITFSDVLIDDSFEADPKPTRKPQIGLVLPLLSRGEVDLKRSVMIGDRDTDLEFARNMGIRGLRVGPDGETWPDLVRQILATPRRGQVERVTRETTIRIEVDLDETARPEITTGIGFFDHMLEQIALHGRFSLKLSCTGDTHIDDHHTIEDCALALGRALADALGDRRGIARYGFVLPMDECQALTAIDLGGRPYARVDIPFTNERVGELATEMIPHFFASLAQTLGAAIHIRVTGENNHHLAEAAFKSVARCLRQAVALEGGDIPSSKGVIECLQ